MTSRDNFCLSCGACCAFYRASFYWSELDDFTSGGVPAGMTQKMDDFRVMMKGTGGSSPRCIALIGDIGSNVFCSIYSRRASVCRDFEASWQNHRPNLRCDKARLARGLPPLKSEDWIDPGNDFPKAA
jgi:Fe-S-cluster containining protein